MSILSMSDEETRRLICIHAASMTFNDEEIDAKVNITTARIIMRASAFEEWVRTGDDRRIVDALLKRLRD